ncbi:MAG: hypothetical protein BWY69_01453 [Planctomycetes bacterium ADurb.Bin401]|nr:MAG: hypothetical protein BWY69_01453 [Planctomycetes bacterium ADurb.Bin401]
MNVTAAKKRYINIFKPDLSDVVFMVNNIPIRSN